MLNFFVFVINGQAKTTMSKVDVLDAQLDSRSSNTLLVAMMQLLDEHIISFPDYTL